MKRPVSHSILQTASQSVSRSLLVLTLTGLGACSQMSVDPGTPQLPDAYYGAWDLVGVSTVAGSMPQIQEQDRAMILKKLEQTAEFYEGKQLLRTDHFAIEKRKKAVVQETVTQTNESAEDLIISFESDPEEKFIIAMPEQSYLKLEAISGDAFTAIYERRQPEKE